MHILRSWREIKVMLKRRFDILTDADFVLEDDDRETMLNQLSSKLNKSRSELEMLFAELQKL